MFALLMVALFVSSSFSQTSTLTFTNDVLVNAKTWQVDVILKSTSGDPIELAALTLGFQIPVASFGAGTLTATWVAGSIALSNTGQVPGKSGINTTATSTVGGVAMRLLKCAGQTPPGAGNGSLISTTGTRIGRLQIVTDATHNWVPNTLSPATNMTFDIAATGYPSAFNAYISSSNVNIWSSVTVVKTLTGPVLPVELTSFASASQGRTVVLNWSTKTEKNSDRFEVERSVVGTESWSTVGSVKAAVLSSSTKNYSYSDTKLQSGKYQYRLKMVDNNGSFSYSSVEAAEVAVPKDFSVSQNYPNPFNPSTKIDYQVPVDAKVIMEVYNIAGQKVMELVNQQMSAGYYTVDFGASKLSSGVYIYRLAASDLVSGHNFSSIKKMMLLK
jgi:hypothetical protein